MKIYKENGERKVWLTSDLHLCHDKEFIWGPRGFKNVDEMNAAIIANWNRVVGPADIVFVLGDLMLYDNEKGKRLIGQLKGTIVPVRGNHDTDERWKSYLNLYNVESREKDDLVVTLKYKDLTFYLSHYPTLCGNYDGDKPLSRRTVNLCGHLHTTDCWHDWDKGLIYHVELDAHDNTPVALDKIIEDIQGKIKG